VLMWCREVLSVKARRDRLGERNNRARPAGPQALVVISMRSERYEKPQTYELVQVDIKLEGTLHCWNCNPRVKELSTSLEDSTHSRTLLLCILSP
jgi:hypothetical protein